MTESEINCIKKRLATLEHERKVTDAMIGDMQSSITVTLALVVQRMTSDELGELRRSELLVPRTNANLRLDRTLVRQKRMKDILNDAWKLLEGLHKPDQNP